MALVGITFDIRSNNIRLLNSSNRKIIWYNEEQTIYGCNFKQKLYAQTLFADL